MCTVHFLLTSVWDPSSWNNATYVSGKSFPLINRTYTFPHRHAQECFQGDSRPCQGDNEYEPTSVAEKSPSLLLSHLHPGRSPLWCGLCPSPKHHLLPLCLCLNSSISSGPGTSYFVPTHNDMLISVKNFFPKDGDLFSTF